MHNPKNLTNSKFWHVRLYKERRELETTDNNGYPLPPDQAPIYNIEDIDAAQLERLLFQRPAIAEAYYQHECSPAGMHHWQMTVVLNREMNPYQVRSLFKMIKGEYCAPVENLEASITYCQKDATRIEGPYHYIRPAISNALRNLIKFI